ncbi:MAG: CheR family methyltransferase [Bryobacteraceae bacterium]
MYPSLDAPALRPLTQREFEQFRRLARDTFGLDLGAGKEPLVAARLGKVAGRLRMRSYQEYYEHVLADSTGQALLAMVEALATNHTGFLREPEHFEFLAQIALSEWQDRDRVRIWSTACSSGEEPYSAAFCLLDCATPRTTGNIDIFATDISNRVLEAAANGVYAAARFANVPRHWLSRYLLRGQGHFEGFYRIKPEVQRLVGLQRLNLIEPFPNMEPFSLIFCRNVMIYFDRPTQESLVGRAAALLEPGGYFFIGHSESLSAIEQPLEYVRPAIYRKPGPCGGAGKRNRAGSVSAPSLGERA